MSTLNLGIVAHVDAGKTTLTERLLFETGVSSHLGRVDHGDTVTDADAIERRRGITIRSAVVTFTVLTRRRQGEPHRHPGARRLRRRGRTRPGRARRGGARRLRGRGCAGPDPGADPDHGAARRPVPGVRQQDRPQRGVRRRHHGRAPGGARRGRRRRQPSRWISAAGRRPCRRDTEPSSSTSCSIACPRTTTPCCARRRGSRPSPRASCVRRLARSTAAGNVHPVVFGAALHGVGVRDLLDALPAFLPRRPGRPTVPCTRASSRWRWTPAATPWPSRACTTGGCPPATPSLATGACPTAR